MTDTLAVSTVDTPLVSVVMVTHGAGETAVKAVKALIENTDEPFELVIVDNPSGDRTAAALKENIQGATIVENEDNVGFARASNQGADLCSGHFLCFLNPDSFVQPGWLRPLLQAFERNESVGVAVPLFLHEDGRVQEAGSALDSRGVAFSVGDGEDASSFSVRFPRPIDFGSAACLVVRADLFDEVDGFDPVYTPAYYEDADLCFRLNARGYITVYEPDSRVVHLRGGSTPRARRLTWMNRRIFLERWRDRLELRKPLRADQDNPRMHPAHRDAEQLERILVIDDRVPHHDRGSGDPRMAKLVAEVADLWPDARVTFLGAVPSNAERYAAPLLAQGIEVAVADDQVRQWFEQRRYHYSVVLVSRASNIDRFEQELRRTQAQARRIYDIEALAFRREDDEQTAKLEELEGAGIGGADVVLCASEDEASYARDRTDAPVFVLPTYVDPLEHPPGYEDRAGVAFFGGFLAGPGGPNEDAAAHLVRDVMPLLWERLPALEVEILGANPTPVVRELQGPRVNVVGFVPDPIDRLSRLRVHVHPLRIGAGIKLKLIDTMAAGLPFVTTPTGAEGLGLADLEDVLVAESPSDLTRLALELYENAGLWADVQGRLLDLVSRRFGRESFRRTLIEAFANIGVAPPAGRVLSSAE
ncbi:MAG TPA: glycosyltransferase [Gaiellaceae bacterium]|jgi:GT2 family glycosyltransferase